MATAVDLTADVLLGSWRAGSTAARDELFARFYHDLRQMAAALARRERHVSLSPTDLLHEAAERMVSLNRIEWNDRAHFFALASRMLRRALVDHARWRGRGKRAHERITLVTDIPDVPSFELNQLDDALTRLAAIDEERARIVEMRFFGGMETREIAVALDMSEATVKRQWNGARLWLIDALGEPPGEI